MPTPSRLRRAVGAVCLALLLAGCSPSGEPAQPPGTDLPTLDATDGVRHPGNWNLIHRADGPAGWRLSQQQVSASHELTSWRRIGAEASTICGVSLWAAGAVPEPGGGEPVAIHGTPGVFLGEPASYESLTGLWWHYRPDAWASVDCRDLGRAEHVALAEQVTLRPTRLLLPFRLTSVPEGMRVDYLGWDQVTGPASYDLGLSWTAEEEWPLPPQISMRPTSRPSTSPDGEQLTLNGRPAVLDLRARTLCLLIPGWQACVEGGPDSSPAEPDGDQRLRERLLAVGQRLVIADDLDQPATWFDGNAAAGG